MYTDDYGKTEYFINIIDFIFCLVGTICRLPPPPLLVVRRLEDGKKCGFSTLKKRSTIEILSPAHESQLLRAGTEGRIGTDSKEIQM